MIQRLMAEALGTFWIVFAGCGSVVLGREYSQLSIGVFGVSIAFGLTVVTMVYALGHISGAHLNPAVSVGLMVSKRFPAREVPGYIAAQVVGGILGGGILYLIASGKAGVDPLGWVSNGYGDHSPGGYSLLAGFCAEAVLAFMFLIIILGVTDSRAPQGFAPLAIGLAVALINLVGIPVTKLSLNPARSTGTAIFADLWALQQLWLFWVAPILGGALAGVVYPFMAGHPPSSPKR
jgi:aquaporin Z